MRRPSYRIESWITECAGSSMQSPRHHCCPMEQSRLVK
ncbi:hypothetical protein MUK42_35907, partial [Musa troglodytarum]